MSPYSIMEGSVRATYETELSWQFEANFASWRRGSLDSTPLHAAPLDGDWSLSVKRHPDSRKKIAFTLTHGPLEYAQIGERVRIEMRLFWLRDDVFESVTHTTLDYEPLPTRPHHDAIEACGGYAFVLKEDPPAHCPPDLYRSVRRFRFTATVKIELPHVPRGAHQTPFPDLEKARRLASGLERPYQDVCLFFPRASPNGARLWTNVSLLRRSSPYFDALFTCTYAETAHPFRGQLVLSRDACSSSRITDNLSAKASARRREDSDDEGETATNDSSGATKEEHDFECCQVTILETSVATYRAVLLFLETGYIAFAPLSSLSPAKAESASSSPLTTDSRDDSDSDSDSESSSDSTLSNAESKQSPPAAENGAVEGILTRKEHSDACSRQYPGLPSPVSPKSVYRLAHLLQLRTLQKLALAELQKNLTKDNALIELTSPCALAHDEVRRVIYDYVHVHWSDMKDSPTWSRFWDQMTNGEHLAEAAHILVELLRIVYPD